MTANRNPFSVASAEEGQKLFKVTQDANKAAEKVVPVGKKRISPAEFRKQQQESGPQERTLLLNRLLKEQGGNKRLAIKEYRRMLGG